MKFKLLKESEEPVLLSYLPDKQYKASYIDSAGQLFIVDFNPIKEMNIAEAIQTIKKENMNFFKLQGIKEVTTESKDTLTEDTTNTEDLIAPEDFKEYIEEQIKQLPVNLYVKQITADKPNVYNDFYVYLHGRDGYDTETEEKINDVLIKIPYTSSKEETEKNIKNAADELLKIYDNTKIALID